MQTAVEWLLQELDKVNYHPTEAMIMYAKKLEKEQIIEAAERWKGTDFAEKYYNETYGSKGSDEAKNDSAKCGIIDNVDYWEKTLEYWKAEKQISNIGSTYYGLCCARIGIIEDFFKCIQPIDATSSQTEISDEVTRIEVIDKQGRVYTQWNCNIELSYQDDGRTLKIFVNN